MRHDSGPYGLITAFRNEAAWLEGVVRSVAGQSVPPLRWVLVDDGSTDGSLERARTLVANLPFADVFSMPPGGARSFASQVHAQLAGVARLDGLAVDFVGFLDADILLPPDYYARLLAQFAADAQLGIAGGKVVDRLGDQTVDTRAGSQEHHVAGGVQLFREPCYRQTGGYIPIAGGGQDVLIETTAMMHGWKVRAFDEPVAIHLRPDGAGPKAPFRRHYRWGRKFYTIGYHPLYFLGATLSRLAEPPFLLSAVCKASGFLGAAITRAPRAVSPDVMRFLRQQQMQRLRARLAGRPRD